MQKEKKTTGQRKLDDLSEELDNEGTKQRRLVEEEAKLKAEAAVSLQSFFFPAQFNLTVGTRKSRRSTRKGYTGA